MALLLLVTVGLLYLANAATPPVDSEAGDLPGERLELRLQAQFELGVRSLLAPAVGEEDSDLLPGETSARRLEALAETTRDRIALVPVYMHLNPTEEAQDSALRDLTALAADDSLDSEIRSEAAVFAGLYRRPAVQPTAAQREQLVAVYGWFALLAFDDPQASEEARRITLALYGVALVLVLALLLGTGTCLVLLRRLARGQLRSAYRRRRVDAAGHGWPKTRLPFLETALLFLVAMTVIGGLIGLAMTSSGSHWLLLLNWTIVAVLFWPLARGRSWPELRSALGWHRGRGLVTEIGCGLVAYLAAMPLLAVGLVLTLILTRFTEKAPHHPIVDWLQEAGAGGIAVVVILAVVWAPLVEESLFRGSFYHYLRGRFGIAGSVLLVSLVFAAIHPQGLAGIPFLATLAAVLGLTREWRDSLVASVTLHMVHNALATLLLLVLTT